MVASVAQCQEQPKPLGEKGAEAAAVVASEPVVARVEMKLALGEEVVDIIEKGDLLTVLEDRGQNYLIQTHTGRKGIVAKVNALKLAESSDIYSELIAEDDANGRLFTLRASTWWALGDTARALADFDKAIEMGYDQPHAFSSRGLFHAAMGKGDLAVADFGRAIEKAPKDESHLVNRAAVFMEMQQYEKAVADYTSALALKPENPALFQQRAIGHKWLGKLVEATQDFDKAIQLVPNSIPALMGRGFVHFQRGQYPKAIEDFSKVIELNPQAAVAFNNRGYNRQQIGKFVDAAADYAEALRLAPDYALALQNQAWLLATCSEEKVRDPKKAIASANRACELSDFKNVSDLAALAAALAADGQFEKAVGWQEKVVEQADPSQREYTKKVLECYRSDRPIDPELLPKLGAEGRDT
jgi:tetratricopeptide (TPR) repeat protein